jgi:DNA-binding CsgD family transcriptional regulator
VIRRRRHRIAERAAAGAANREIAQSLFITPTTVETHRGNACRKLGVTSRSELAAALASTPERRRPAAVH